MFELSVQRLLAYTIGRYAERPIEHGLWSRRPFFKLIRHLLTINTQYNKLEEVTFLTIPWSQFHFKYMHLFSLPPCIITYPLLNLNIIVLYSMVRSYFQLCGLYLCIVHWFSSTHILKRCSKHCTPLNRAKAYLYFLPSKDNN
jgi:hypothetical protein